MDKMVRSFEQPDMQVTTARGNANCRRLQFDQVGVGFAVMHPGFRWSADVKTLPGADQWVKGDLCELVHIGIVLDGTYHFELADGRSFDVRAGEMYHVPEGTPHDEWVVGDEVCRAVDIWPA